VDERGFSFFKEPADHLDLPNVPLSVRRTYYYRVLDLPQVIYPRVLSLEVPEQEDFDRSGDYPWNRCLVRASLLTPARRAFHTRTYLFGRDRAGSSPGRHGRRDIVFPFTDYSISGTTGLPQYLSYVVQIEVLQPSSRATDALSIKAFTVVDPNRPKPLREGAIGGFRVTR
jgi:hypothetical protein